MPAHEMKILLLSIGALILALFTGCQSAPFERTYSVEYRDGKQSISTSVTLKPSGCRK